MIVLYTWEREREREQELFLLVVVRCKLEPGLAGLQIFGFLRRCPRCVLHLPWNPMQFWRTCCEPSRQPLWWGEWNSKKNAEIVFVWHEQWTNEHSHKASFLLRVTWEWDCPHGILSLLPSHDRPVLSIPSPAPVVAPSGQMPNWQFRSLRDVA